MDTLFLSSALLLVVSEFYEVTLYEEGQQAALWPSLGLIPSDRTGLLKVSEIGSLQSEV
jgi:hypothetical protein